MQIYTIGHSSHSKEAFLKMLTNASIKALIDVRAFPGSRKYPQFSKDQMMNWLKDANIEYHHLSKLGGRRKRFSTVGIKLNDGWNNQSFHNYADYTLSDTFREGIDELSRIASKQRTAYFCSESHPASCHRLIISNWLAANDWKVKHIIEQNNNTFEVIDHELGKWGAMPIIEKNGTVVYPKI